MLMIRLSSTRKSLEISFGHPDRKMICAKRVSDDLLGEEDRATLPSAALTEQ